MNVSRFFEHWGLNENPFSAEEARHDAVFARLPVGAASHPELEKIIGELDRSATSIVFGEKGSGKTAIRMQIARRIDERNRERPDEKILLVAYDDLNPILDHFCERMRADGAEKIDAALAKLKLTDHMDAILHSATVALVDEALAGGGRAIRHADPSVRADFVLLQAVYDQTRRAARRTVRLRRAVRAPYNWSGTLWTTLAWIGAVLPLSVVALWLNTGAPTDERMWLWALIASIALWGVLIAKRYGWDAWRLGRLGARIARRTRVLGRSGSSVAESLAFVPPAHRDRDALPADGSEDARYRMFEKLRGVMRAMGYSGAVVAVDRIDEPTVVSGDPERMKTIIWPLLTSKFLQMEGFGFKMLLPIELRHALFRESSAFFQEARLDKQNLIEQLSWTGATLYDLCVARLNACRSESARPLTLTDLFADDVSRQDVVDALDQMHQPRDAFKMIHRCIQEHCSNITDDEATDDEKRRIPRLILETVRRQQAERVQQLYRGVRPA